MAILHEGDEPGVVTEITYEDLLRKVCRVANAMRELGVEKGDFVTLYMPMVPEAAVAMLACARLGAPHSVVFAGFSAEALRDRIVVRIVGVCMCYKALRVASGASRYARSQGKMERNR